MEDGANCSLCMEVFTDPVSLPCGHGFCRGCLKSLADHTSRRNGEKQNPVGRRGKSTSTDSILLPCPLCRAEVALGSRGLDDLYPHQDLVKKIQSSKHAMGSVVSAPLCDMCEGEKKRADSYCTNCMTLYCAECLNSLHPRRGPFGRHRLISMNEYMSKTTPHTTVVNTSLTAEDLEVTRCTDHKEPLSFFCDTCEQLICTKCISQHYDQITPNFASKSSVEEQLNDIRGMKFDIQQLRRGLVSTQKAVQAKIDQEYNEIEENYERSLKILQHWRKSEREKVDSKRDTLTSKTLSLVITTELMIQETDRLVTSSSELLSGNDALFHLESKKLLARLQRHSIESTQELEDKRQKMAEVQSSLPKLDFRPCVVMIPGNKDGVLGPDSGQHFLGQIGYNSLRPTETHQPCATPTAKVPPRKVQDDIHIHV